jgi:hypothetical protein
MAVLLGLWLEALWIPIYLLMSPPLTEKYTDKAEANQEMAGDLTGVDTSGVTDTVMTAEEIDEFNA